MPWHILFHIIVGLLGSKKGKKAANLPKPPPRPPLDEGEARRWAEQAARRRRLLLGSVLAGVAHGAFLIAWGVSEIRSRAAAPGPVTADYLAGSGFLALAVALGVLAGALLARSRRRPPLWGVLGLLSILGILGVALLRRRCEDCSSSADAEAIRCPVCLGPI